MNSLFVVCLFVGQTWAATTMMPHTTNNHHHHHSHGTRPSREPVVTESFGFKYDPHAHLMAVTQRHKCYIYSMNGMESTDVHTTHGLRLLETKLIKMVDDTSMTYKTMSHDEVMAASKLVAHNCNRNGTTTYKLN